jgi:tetratricopeptide (TPR) repeat protein
VAVAVVVVLAMPARRPAGGGSGSGSDVLAGIPDAGVTANARADAALIAAVPDAAPAPDAAIAANGPDASAAGRVDAAAKLNEQGEDSMRARDYEVARQRFSQAVAQDPQTKYYLNLATADVKLGYVDAAVHTLREARQRAPTPEEAAEATKLLEIISPKAQRTGRRRNPPTAPDELGAPAEPTAPAPATAGGSQAEIAARRNEEGKELMYAGRYSEAARKFQDAVARVPEAKYFFNLCTVWLQEGKFDAALSACNAVAINNPTPEQQSKAARLIRLIRDEARKQGIELHTGQ